MAFADVADALSRLSEEVYTEHDYASWDLDFLADYIVNQHHIYTRDALSLLMQYAEKVARVHGEEYPETLEIHRIVQAVNDELLAHMDKEEGILFPYIKALADARRHGTPGPFAPFGTVRNPIRMMEDEHTETGDALKRIQELTKGFTLPD